MGIKRAQGKKKKKKLGSLRGSGSGSGVETSSRRPKFVEKTPPCSAECPQGTDIRGVLTSIAQGEKNGRPREELFNEAFYTIAAKNPLPAVCGRVCPHPCETACNRNAVDEPASINSVERFIGDWGLQKDLPLLKTEEDAKEEKIAVVGSGPAGLAAAYHLAKRGYPVTIFEAFPNAGGMLRYGIPAYRLPREVIDAEVQRILDLGVELKTNVFVGRDVAMDDLHKEYKAVFVAIGAHSGRLLRLENEDKENVWTGTKFLRLANEGQVSGIGNKVLVIGGGDTAIDAARVARRLGSEEVTIVYRRTRTEMPAIEEESVGAEEEGITLHFLAAPSELQVEGDKVVRMVCQQMELGEPDDSGRRRPVPIEGDTFTLECDTIVAAISQEPDFEGLENLREGRDWVKVDETGATKEADVYAGGDVLDLGLVTIALAQGRIAADTIHCKLRGLDPAEHVEMPLIKSEKMQLAFYEKNERAKNEEIPPEQRFADPDAEIKSGLTEEQLMNEAGRCLSCGMCFNCGTCWSFCQDSAIVKPLDPTEPYKFKLEFCKGCDKCAEQCPCGYIEMYDPMVSAG